MYQRLYHILVAEQDASALHQVVDALKRRGHVVAGASTPEEARWWIAGWPVDLVVAAPAFGAVTGAALVEEARAAQPRVLGMLAGDGAPGPEGPGGDGDIAVSAAPPHSEEFLDEVARLLAGITRRERWPRTEVRGPVPMRVGRAKGRLMDVSYGGLKFELPNAPYVLRSPLELAFPRADLRLPADVVWSARRGTGRTAVFGAAVSTDAAPATEWRAFVDRLR